MRRASGRRPWSRSGLPLTCGIKLPDGQECRARVVSSGRCARHSDPQQCPRLAVHLVPPLLPHYWRMWLRENGRAEEIPEDLSSFLRWWRELHWLDGKRPPWAVNWDGLKRLWLRWCELAGRPVLVPFDMTRFCDWWRVT